MLDIRVIRKFSTDYPQVLKSINKRFLPEAGVLVSTEAALFAPVDKGRLAGSIKWRLRLSRDQVVIGTNVSYAADRHGSPNSALSLAGDGYVTMPLNMLDPYNIGSIAIHTNLVDHVGSPILFSVGEAVGTGGTWAISLSTSNKIQLVFRKDNNQSLSGIETNSSFPAGTDYTIIITSDGSLWRIYVNNVLQNVHILFGTNSGWWFSDIGASDHNNIIGALEHDDIQTRHMIGVEDFYVVYDDVLSAEERTQIQNMTLE